MAWKAVSATICRSERLLQDALRKPAAAALARLLHSERGAVAVIAAVAITGLVGMVGLGVDLGGLYAAKAQLQNAVDAAAMAGASTMITDTNGDGLVEPDYDGAQATVISYMESNEFGNDPLVWGDTDVFIAGRWNKDTATFDRTGPSADTDDLTGVRVQASRSAPTHFMQFAGLDGVTISAEATAFVGWAADVPAGQVDLPIAIKADAIESCASVIQFNSENLETAEWTSFFDWSANKNSIEDYIDGSVEVPPLSMGDEIYLNNGVIASLFSSLSARFDAEKDATGVWRVMLPVVQSSATGNTGSIVGFVYFVMEEVIGPPDKTMEGHMECQSAISSGSTTGGGDYGVRAGRPVLIN